MIEDDDVAASAVDENPLCGFEFAVAATASHLTERHLVAVAAAATASTLFALEVETVAVAHELNWIVLPGVAVASNLAQFEVEEADVTDGYLTAPTQTCDRMADLKQRPQSSVHCNPCGRHDVATDALESDSYLDAQVTERAPLAGPYSFDQRGPSAPLDD